MAKFFTAALIGFLAMATSAEAQVAPSKKLQVVASFSLMGDMAREVAGDLADIYVIAGANANPHSYQTTVADQTAIARSSLVIANGLGLEGWIDPLIKATNYKGLFIIASTGIPPLSLGNSADPHAWQNLHNAHVYVNNIRDAMIVVDAIHADKYKANAQAYLQQLAELDSWAREQFAAVPEDKRRAVVSHNAFQYFSYAYGVKITAPVNAITEADIAASDIPAFIKDVQSDKTTAIFAESTSTPQLLQLEKNAGAFFVGTLYSDALSSEKEPAPTFATMFRYNVTQLVNAMNAQE